MSKRQQTSQGEFTQFAQEGDTRQVYDQDFATLLEECIKQADDNQGGGGEEEEEDSGELTSEQLDVIAGMGVEGLEREYEKYCAKNTTEVANNPEIQKEALEELEEHHVQSKLIIVDNIPEQAQLVKETEHQVPAINATLSEFDEEMLLDLIRDPYVLLAENEKRTKTRVALPEFHRFSKTLVGKRINGPLGCDKVIFSSNKTHCRAQEQFEIKYPNSSYTLLFYYIDESIFSGLVFTSDWNYKGCFFIQAKECLLHDLLRMKEVV